LHRLFVVNSVYVAGVRSSDLLTAYVTVIDTNTRLLVYLN